MEMNKTYQGTVTYFSPEKHFGFLDTDFQEGIFFFIDIMQSRHLSREERKRNKSKFVRGDEVSFKLKRSEKSEFGYEAYDLQFIKNEKITQLFELSNIDSQLSGFLKKIGDDYFVKDKATYLLIPLIISNWEINIRETYENRINEPVFYTIRSKPDRPQNLKAVLCDRVFNNVYHQMNSYKENNVSIPATITGKNNDGYFATILDGTVSTFILFDKNGTVPRTFQKWDSVEVTIKSVNDSGVSVKLTSQNTLD